MNRTSRADGASSILLAFAGLAPIVVGAALVSVRGSLLNSNIALIFVIVVVLAAIGGGRAAGALAAITAAASFDFFFTKPYLSVVINDADDVETTMLLLLIGLVVGQLVLVGRRSRRAADDAHEQVARLHRVAELAAHGAPSDSLVRAVAAEVSSALSLRECIFEEPPFGFPLPRLERNGAVASELGSTWYLVGGEFALPPEGVELLVLGGGRQVGRFVCEPEPDVGVSLERRIVALALADQLGAALGPPADPSATRQESPS